MSTVKTARTAAPEAAFSLSSRSSTESIADDYLAAAAKGNLDGVRVALEAGVDRDIQNDEEASAILLAARGGHLDVVAALIEAGVDIDAQDQVSANPFLHGCMTDNLPLVQMMVNAGADHRRLTRMGGNGLTPAAEKGFVSIVSYLLEHTRINVNLTNHLGWTALIETIILGDGGPSRQQIVQMLLDNGAKPGMPDKWGVLPVQLARERGFDRIVDIIERTQ